LNDFNDDFLHDDKWLRSCVEAIMFISENPVTPVEIAESMNVRENRVKMIISELEKEYSDQHKGFMIRKVANGYRFYSNPELQDVLRNFVRSNIRSYLSQAALETIAIMCYLQPVTRTQIAEIRGVRTDSVFQTLLDRGLIKEAGRLKEPGNPKLYRTSSRLLEILGIASLDELPPLRDLSAENSDISDEGETPDEPGILSLEYEGTEPDGQGASTEDII
jgi:segregation and condensation protein B